MTKKLTRILLIEDHPADAEFVREALVELEERSMALPWLSRLEMTHCECLAEATEMLQAVSFDVILLDLGLGDSSGLDTFHQVHAAAPESAILVLSTVDDPSLAVHLMQEGAQDFLLKQELDCSPLARALRCAMERNRVATGLRSLSIRDELTGLLNLAGFQHMALQQSRVLRRCAATANLVLLRVGNLEWIHQLFGRHERDWLIIEVSELFRGLAGEADVAAYLGEGNFALLTLDHEGEKVGRYFEALETEIRARAERRSMLRPVEIRVGQAQVGPANLWDLEAAMEIAGAALWENVADPLSCLKHTPAAMPSVP
jgi:PleD family two-component response regulator